MNNLLNLKNKTAIITGGSRGIGASIVRTFSNAGANVIFTYLKDEKAAQETVSKCSDNSISMKADCTSMKSAGAVIEKAISVFGGLDIIVTNAGITNDRVVWKQTESDFNSVIDTNLKGAFNIISSAAKHLREQKSGKIVTISSINGIRGKAGQGAYSASKGGLIAFTKSIAKELGLKNINANIVAPGLIETDMMKNLPDDIKNKALEETAIKRLGKPQDVADTVLFLCSDLSNHITGQVINVDGGQLI